MPFLRGQNQVSFTQLANIRRFEFGGQVADIRTVCAGEQGCPFPQFGLGAGATLNFKPYFALDAVFNITPGFAHESSATVGGRLSEFLAGARVEARAKHYGFFLAAQSGVEHWNHVVTNFTLTPAPTGYYVNETFGGHSSFIANIGGGVEYSPGARIHVRTEVGDLIIHNASADWSNNLQASVGIYAGLGKPLTYRARVYDARKTHRFLDVSNVLLLYTNALSQTADAVTTQRGLSRGLGEENPFAAPLVKYGWSGQISLAVLETTGDILGMYGLHRINQHWLERLLPVCGSVAHGVFAYNNTKVSYTHP
jgi:hypothetical protein